MKEHEDKVINSDDYVELENKECSENIQESEQTAVVDVVDDIPEEKTKCAEEIEDNKEENQTESAEENNDINEDVEAENSEEIETSQTINKTKNKKKILIICGAILGSLLIIGLILVLIFYAIPNSHYKKGKEAFENEEYKVAYKEFQKAKDFKDSKKQAELSIKANSYNLAEEALEEKDYKEAISYYEEAKGYEDANEKLVNVYIITGQFELAYTNAKDNKKDILFQNLIAYLCKEATDMLKDPDSFGIRELWFVEEDKHIVMEIEGTNSYGGVVSSYWLYTFDEDEKMYEFFENVELDLEKEEYSYYDDYEEEIEKLYYNIAIDYVDDIVFEDKYHMSDNIVEVMNLIKENDALDSIELLDETKFEYCNDDSDA